jgi:predicted permease
MELFRDIQFAFRTLRKNPGFALAAILALALGIGANSAMFSVIDGVLLRPLPFPEPERLVNVWESALKRNIPKMVAPPGNYYDWRKQNQVFSSMGAYQGSTFNLAATGSEPERYVGAICDPGFFSVLGVKALLGRTIAESEDAPGGDGVVVLGYGVWRQRFGADSAIVGRSLNLDGRARTVIGVMPESFQFPPKAVMWAPFAFDNETHERRDFHRLRVIARLKPDVTLARARADFDTIGVRLAKQYPDLNQDETLIVNPMLEDAVGQVRPALYVLLGAVAFVLLIACANVANLLLAKSAGRRREIAIRGSLGAGRARIVRQMLAESVLLSLTGGAAGLLLAHAAFRGLLALAPANVPRLAQAVLDWRVTLFTLAISVFTGIVFGFAPAWHTSRMDLNSLLKEGARGTTSRNRLRGALVVAQVAAALILLAGAGLLVRSFYEIEHIDSGFNPERVMTMRLAPAQFKYKDHDDRQIQLARGILEKVRALPGVVGAAISTDVPLLGNPFYIMRFEGRPPVSPSQAPIAGYFEVTPTYFETMGMRLLRGRLIAESDTPGSPLVVVVNQTLVDRYFHGQDPIGKRLEIAFSDPPNWREIVGVVADVHSDGLDQDTPVQVYTAYLQRPTLLRGIAPAITVLARTAGEPGRLGEPMKAAILQVDRSQPVFSVQPMTEIVSQSVSQRRFSLVLLGFFAFSALFLAALGLYGVLSYAVTQRTSEIGVRMALGAGRAQVLLLMQKQGLRLVLAGMVVGIAGALLLTRLMRSLLFHVGASDAVTFLGVAVMLALVALFASYLPALRASKIDPIVALRHE